MIARQRPNTSRTSSRPAATERLRSPWPGRPSPTARCWTWSSRKRASNWRGIRGSRRARDHPRTAPCCARVEYHDLRGLDRQIDDAAIRRRAVLPVQRWRQRDPEPKAARRRTHSLRPLLEHLGRRTDTVAKDRVTENSRRRWVHWPRHWLGSTSRRHGHNDTAAWGVAPPTLARRRADGPPPTRSRSVAILIARRAPEQLTPAAHVRSCA